MRNRASYSADRHAANNCVVFIDLWSVFAIGKQVYIKLLLINVKLPCFEQDLRLITENLEDKNCSNWTTPC